MGFRCQTISRDTLANANAARPWQIYAVYAFDASTIDLCLSVFAWAPFRSTKAAIKLHTLLDLRGRVTYNTH